MNLQVLLILGLPLGLLAVNVNSSLEDHEALSESNETSFLETHETQNRSSEDRTSNAPDDDLLPTVATIIGISTYKPLRNPSYSSSTDFPSIEIVVGASINAVQEHHQSSTTKDTPASTQHSLNATDATIKSFVSLNDSDVHKTKELSIDATTPKEGQNEGNSDSFFSKRQNKSVLDDQQRVNFLPSSVVTPPSSLNTSSEFPNLSTDNLSSQDNTLNTSVNEEAKNQFFTLKSEIVTETTSITLVNQQTINQNSSEPTDADILIKNGSVVIKNDQEYTVIVPRICSNNSIITHLLHLLNDLPDKRTPNFTCEKLKDMKIAVKSKQLFNKINDFLKTEAESDDMVFIKVSPNDTLSFEILPQSSFNGVFIPMYLVIITGSIVACLLFIILCVCLYKKFCRRHSTSLDLHHMPHLNLKADYNLTPIPRPSISFPDSNGDFMHAYAQDNYHRSRQENILNKRNSCSMAKTYEEVDKEIRSKNELSTFTMSSGRKSDFKAPSQDYAPSHSWDRLQENNYAKKYGVDNPGYKKW